MEKRPVEGEFPSYFDAYIKRVPEGDVIAILGGQLEETLCMLEGVTEEQAAFRYASGKWSLKEVIGHMTDTERIMAYRLLRIARGDETPLPGFSEELFVQNAGFDRLSMSRLLNDFRHVRQSTLSLLTSLPDEAWTRVGQVSGYPHSALAIACVIAGHELHHGEIIRSRYLQQG